MSNVKTTTYERTLKPITKKPEKGGGLFPVMIQLINWKCIN